jgi:hypothetical protein
MPPWRWSDALDQQGYPFAKAELLGALRLTRRIALGLRIVWQMIVHLIYDGGMIYAGHIAFIAAVLAVSLPDIYHHACGRVGADGRRLEFIAIGLGMLPEEVSGVTRPAVDEVVSTRH